MVEHDDIPVFDTPSIPAATIILFRERDGRAAQHLMIRRTSRMVFAGGAMVFPGGRVEADDAAIGNDPGLVRNAPEDAFDRAARVAAIRETVEETGIAIALDPEPSETVIRDWRKQLKNNEPFSDMLRAEGVTLDLSELVPFARWCPKLGDKRRFDTMFYLARTDADDELVVDPDEASHFAWITAADAVAAEEAGTHEIVFPTKRNLERLALCPDFDAARAHAEGVPVKTIEPWISEEAGERYLTIPDDAGYPITRAPLAEVMHLFASKKA